MLLLRPAQQYRSLLPVEGELSAKLVNRVSTLARGWEHLQDAGVDAVQLASLETITPPSSKINLQFYPEEGSRTSISSLDLDSSELQTPDQIAVVSEKHKIPVDDQLNLLHRARIITNLQDRSTRRTLLAIRLLAIAICVYLVPGDATMTIFLNETSLIQELSHIMASNKDVGGWVLSSAIYALDAFAHDHPKWLEVVTTVGANVSHGIVISFFRDTVLRLTDAAPDAEGVQFEVMDATFGFIAHLIATPSHATNLTVGANVIPSLLEVPKTRVTRRESVSFSTAAPLRHVKALLMVKVYRARDRPYR